MRRARAPANFGFVHVSANLRLARSSTIATTKRISGRVRKLKTVSITRGSAGPSQGAADAAVLADAPEVHGHEHHGHHGHRDAVQDVEPQQGLLADEAPAEQR